MPTPNAPSRRRRTVLAAAALTASLATVAALLATAGNDTHDHDDAAPAATADSSSSTAPPTAEENRRGPDLSHLARRDPDDPLARGRADAPVVLIEYADFQCPFCGRFARRTEPRLVEKYVRKGVLRIEWRNFPVFGKESEQAALAAWAAGRQNRFRQFHDLLYAAERERNSGEFADDRLVEFARRAGVPDLEQFRSDMASREARRSLGRDREEGYRLGVSSTPAFLVGDTPILGAQPTRTFEKAVEQAAERARQEDREAGR
ncbi:DsbA family protein [Streptomyces sp. TR06-5]|uniref:DsbA family protein n=1 Tax=unclassified Streptomyces TaxID=2593676 RepID=UPI0039A0E490